MNVEQFGTSKGDIWTSYHQKLASYEGWRRLLQKAKLYASGCYNRRCGTDDAMQYTSADPAVSPYVSSRVSENCGNPYCVLLSPARFDEYLTKHPHACTTHPALAKEKGNCPELLGDLSHDQIRAKRDRIQWHAHNAHMAIVDYMYSRGINAWVMTRTEIENYIDHLNEMDAGDPYAAILIDRTAPGVPDIDPRAAVTPPGGLDFDWSKIPQYVMDYVKPENLPKNWPGLALGLLLFMVKVKKRKAVTA